MAAESPRPTQNQKGREHGLVSSHLGELLQVLFAKVREETSGSFPKQGPQSGRSRAGLDPTKWISTLQVIVTHTGLEREWPLEKGGHMAANLARDLNYPSAGAILQCHDLRWHKASACKPELQTCCLKTKLLATQLRRLDADPCFLHVPR